MQNKFLDIIKSHECDLKKYNKSFAIIGYVKLCIVALMVFLIYLAVFKELSLRLIVALLAVAAVLVILWIYHGKIHDKINYSNGIISICKHHIDRITGNWTAFEDTGSEFADTDHAYSADLDIIGKKSLFQLLNTTGTWHGRQAFADDLLRPEYNITELNMRQKAVAELSGNIEFSCEIQYYLSKIGADSSTANLIDELKKKTPFIKSKAVKALLTYAPVLSSVFIIGIIMFSQQRLYTYGIAIAVLQAIVWVIGISKTRKYLGALEHLPYKFSAYGEAINILAQKDFSSEKLNKIREQVVIAEQAIKDLSKIANKINVKHNAIIYFIANILLLWDYECALHLEKWKNKYSDSVEQWFLAIGEFESLLCLSHLPNICDNICLPHIIEEASIIEASDIGHPLLLNEKRVNNDLRLCDNIFIISGSNMSGKTTFLRSIGINLVLARTGGFVCAKKMTCSMLRIVTSMRIADDLNEGASTFYAELKRIKKIIDLAKERRDIIFLIDEIFRGTNSADRLIGAKTVIERLNTLGALGLISTHDLELCQVSDNRSRINNHSFTEHYIDNKICFDYKIKNGKSTTTNAEFLMRMVGISEE